ncbi:MAG: hypothetical protein PHD37_07495 [Gallionellaceae bacterium]|nr:hypothetical protein [Gallionellaceae bacterium]MDD5389173.1 hypothetical protein [Gallionellaceae bacterium]
MTNEELIAHFEYIDGVQKAQSLVLRALLRQQPAVMSQLQNYLSHLESQAVYHGLTNEQQQAMKSALNGLVALVQAENA